MLGSLAGRRELMRKFGSPVRAQRKCPIFSAPLFAIDWHYANTRLQDHARPTVPPRVSVTMVLA